MRRAFTYFDQTRGSAWPFLAVTTSSIGILSAGTTVKHPRGIAFSSRGENPRDLAVRASFGGGEDDPTPEALTVGHRAASNRVLTFVSSGRSEEDSRGNAHERQHRVERPSPRPEGSRAARGAAQRLPAPPATPR